MGNGRAKAEAALMVEVRAVHDREQAVVEAVVVEVGREAPQVRLQDCWLSGWETALLVDQYSAVLAQSAAANGKMRVNGVT